MFNQYLLILIGQKKEYEKLMEAVGETPLKKSIEYVLKNINADIDKITQLNQIEYIY